MFPILLRIGPFTLHTYGLLVAIGFLTALYVSQKQFQLNGLPTEILDQSVMVIAISGIFGARLFYVLTMDWEGFVSAPFTFFMIWEGGLVYYGSFIIGLIGLYWYSRYRKIPFVGLTDAFMAPLFLGQAFGRLGCFSAGCCYGKPTDSILGVTFTHPESLAPTFISLHPTQLYSAMANFLMFIGIYLISKSSPKRGVLSATYLVTYGIFRFVIEFIREDYRGPAVLNLYPSQWISIAAVVLGSVWLRRIHTKSEPI